MVEIVNRQQLAQILSRTVRSIDRYVQIGKLPKPRVICNRRVWLKSEIDQLIQTAPVAGAK